MTISQSSNSRATAAALTLVVVLGFAALYQVTLGLRVVATEDGRRLKIAEHPLALPRTQLATTPPVDLLDNLRLDGRVAIVTFFYARCSAVCSSLGSQYQQLQAATTARGAQHRIRLLSISFDSRDTPAALTEYAMRQHAQRRVWQLVGIADAHQRTVLLSSFGIVVLPAPLGEFQHNAAFHVVDSEGRLMRIFDLDSQDAALAYALSLASRRGI